MKNKILIIIIIVNIAIKVCETMKNEYTNKKSLNKTFKILMWTTIWSKYDWNNKRFKALKCEYSNCNLSSNRTDINTSDAVFFHWRDVSRFDLPIRQYPNQKWVLFNLESPAYTPLYSIKRLMVSLNWTMTYRKDSDIYTPYGEIVKCERKWKPNYDFNQKNRSIAWIVSNCYTQSKRENYVKEMQNYIDIYGDCGNNTCKSNCSSFYDLIEKNYKFYLSFENSMCKDYVTEKLFRTIQYDIIPIVMGSGDYSSIMPYNSYIDVSNFTSPLHLVNYLKEIINDENRYKSYFEWKNNHCVENLEKKYFCILCEKMNFQFNTKDKHNWKEEITKWFFNDSNCPAVYAD